jgi:hypothetical protein
MTTKQATKPVTPPCSDGSTAHRIQITGEGSAMSGRCVKDGCTWGRPYDPLAADRAAMAATARPKKTKTEEYA